MSVTDDRKPQLLLFGDARLLDATGRRAPLPHKALILALFLILSNRRAEVSRIEAADFLWPDAPHALTNLRQLIARVRRIQGDLCLFEIDERFVRLNLDEVHCDLLEFQNLILAVDFPSAEKLLDIHGNGLFAESLAESEQPYEWLRSQAASTRNVLVAAISDLLDRSDSRANAATSHLIAERLLRIDPYRESAWRARMRSFAFARQRGRVEQTFLDCSALLLRDLGVSPTAETIATFERLTDRRTPAVRIAGNEPMSAAVETVAGSTALPRLVVLPPLASRSSNDPLFPITVSLVEDVVVGLCSLKTVNLVAPHTSWQLSKRLIADEGALDRFQIGYALETSLSRSGKRSRLSAKLYDTTTRSILWAQSQELSHENSERWYREIAIGIILTVADAIENAELARYEQTQSPTAYYWHLIGQKNLRHVDLPSVRRAAKAFRQGLKADPEFVPAHAGRARTLQREWLLLGRGEHELLQAAETSGRRATELDHRDARGFRELGLCNLYLRRFDDSLAYYAQAERLSSQHADIIADYGDALAHSGEPEQGLAKIKKAMELNPIPPEQYWWDMAGICYQLGRYEEAIEAIGRMDHPENAQRVAAASWAMLGNKKNAARCVTRFLEDYPDFRVETWLAHVPNRRPEDTRHFERGLRAAGFV